MISVMTNEFELNRKPESIEEPEVNVRVSDGDDVNSSFYVVAAASGGGDGHGFVDLSVSDDARVSMELDSVAPGTRVGSRVSDGCGVGNDETGDGRSGDGRVCFIEEPMISTPEEGTVCPSEEARASSCGEVRVCEESGGREMCEETESMDFEVKDAQSEQLDARNDTAEHMESGTDGSDVTPRASVDEFDSRNDLFDSGNDQEGVSSSSRRRQEGEGSGSQSQYDSLLSKFDDYVANGGVLEGAGISKALRFSLEPGEMVWGKVKSHPWWPGHIFSEAFVSPSVRRTKREGHVLVAFFGDSSYGWFDTSELVPFDANFAEKSRQTNMRNFVKAVEEALDEASRRCSLGLTCRCRNSYNFRPADIQGHFIVDVGDYAGGVYSEIQIEKARDSFQPVETLAFIRQLAMTPRDNDQKSIDWIKNTAKVFAYRKAVFEEFDETYAEAFGYPAERPLPKDVTREPSKQAPRAPLSGPLVIAEALGGGRSSTKPPKVKDQLKKDRYLFKRRDEPKSRHISEVPTSSSVPSTVVEGSSTTAAGDYVFQKRASAASIKPQGMVKNERGALVSSQKVTGKQAANIEKKPMVGFQSDQGPAYSSGAVLDSKSSIDKGKIVMLEIKDGKGLDAGPGSMSVDGSALSVQSVGTFHQEGDRTEESEKMAEFHEGYHQPKPNVSLIAEGYSQEDDQVHSGRSGADAVPVGAKFLGMSNGAKVKKAKVLKRPIGDLGSEISVQGEKKKKRKKEVGLEISLDRKQKRSATGKNVTSVAKLAGKPILIDETSMVDSQQDQKENGASSSLPMVDMRNMDLELPQLLSDLHVLALDPFHGAERNSPAIIRYIFLRFRSLVFQKSTSAETESIDTRGNKSAVGGRVSDNSLRENVKDLPTRKPPKPLGGRPDDPTKGGRKRAPSDRQEEMAAKKLKKISDLKSLAAEKKVGLKNPEALRVEGNETAAAPHPPKPVRPIPSKKLDPPARVVDPTMLVMKFPPRTSLPSGPELKARFARFGPLDHDGTRIFWKSSTCRVVFRYRIDAQKAYKYAIGNNSLFGNVNVRYQLRDTAENPESSKGQGGEDASGETPLPRDAGIEHRPSASILHPPPQQLSVQLKSCLKKVTGDEAGNNGGRGTPRVKFMLGGEEEESNRMGEHLMMMDGNRNNNFTNNASFADGGSSSSVGMDFISNNFQKGIPPSPLPILPLPSQFAKLPQNMHFNEGPAPAAPRIIHNFNTSINTMTVPPLPPPATVDISQPMLSLLTRCNDVVSSVRSILGYVPYHPL